MKFKMAVAGGAMAALVLGTLLVVLALGDKIARWAGIAESLPFLGLFALFLAGHMLVTSLVKRPRVRH